MNIVLFVLWNGAIGMVSAMMGVSWKKMMVIEGMTLVAVVLWFMATGHTIK